MRILFQIVFPMSLPIVATLGLMIGLGYWNDWTNGLYFLTNKNLFNIQNLLNQMLMSAQFLASIKKMGQGSIAAINMPSIGVKMAIAVLCAVPVIVVFPLF